MRLPSPASCCTPRPVARTTSIRLHGVTRQSRLPLQADSLTTARVRWVYPTRVNDIAAELHALENYTPIYPPKRQSLNVAFLTFLAASIQSLNQVVIPDDCEDAEEYVAPKLIDGVWHHERVPAHVLLDLDGRYAFHVRTATPPNDPSSTHARAHAHVQTASCMNRVCVPVRVDSTLRLAGDHVVGRYFGSDGPRPPVRRHLRPLAPSCLDGRQDHSDGLPVRRISCTVGPL